MRENGTSSITGESISSSFLFPFRSICFWLLSLSLSLSLSLHLLVFEFHCCLSCRQPYGFFGFALANGRADFTALTPRTLGKADAPPGFSRSVDTDAHACISIEEKRAHFSLTPGRGRGTAVRGRNVNASRRGRVARIISVNSCDSRVSTFPLLPSPLSLISDPVNGVPSSTTELAGGGRPRLF